MEVPKNSEKYLLVSVYEMLGTALFLYCILVSNGNALAVVGGLFASIIIFGGVTGGHFNPAVSLGVYIANGKYASQIGMLISIIAAQFVGACLGFALAFPSLYKSTADGTEINPGLVPKLCPSDVEGGVVECDGSDHYGFDMDVQAFWTQMLTTFVFVSVILMVKGMGGPAPTKDGAAGALAVIATLYGAIFVSLGTGACMNPAVALGISRLVAWSGVNSGGIYTHYLYAYMVGPAVGGMAAGAFALLHNKMHKAPEVEAEDDGYQRVE